MFFFSNVLGSLKDLQSRPIVIFYVLHNNFYTQLPSAFVPWKGFYYTPNNTDVVFLFLL